MSAISPLCRLALMWILCTALLGCGKVIETKPYEASALGYAPTTCRSTLGAYYLPRALLSLSVESSAESGGETGRLTANLSVLPTTMVADRAQPLCLDYLASPTSDDIVTVSRGEKGLLDKITSNVYDKTPEIADKLIQTAQQIAIAAGRSQTTTDAQIHDKLDLQFDPFVWEEMITAKTALRRFGYCLYVEDHSFPVHGLSAAAVQAAAERWCSASVPPRHRDSGEAFANLPVPPEVMSYGILYRPNIAHKIVIMRKRDPSGRDRWTLHQTKRVEMPNASPILAIGVERAAFARRITEISFRDGVLTDVTINKGSELERFAGIPLSVARAIVDIPAQIVQFRIIDIKGQTEILDAQGKLIQAVAEYKKTVNAADPLSAAAAADDAGAPKSATIRSGQFVGGCVNGGGDPATCVSMARSGR